MFDSLSRLKGGYCVGWRGKVKRRGCGPAAGEGNPEASRGGGKPPAKRPGGGEKSKGGLGGGRGGGNPQMHRERTRCNRQERRGIILFPGGLGVRAMTFLGRLLREAPVLRHDDRRGQPRRLAVDVPAGVG